MDISEELQRALYQVLDHFEKEDRAVRERQIRQWKKLKLYWEGFSRIWFSEVAHDWRIWGEQLAEGADQDYDYYDKPVNVFKAYLETIIAALSINIPAICCSPDDADNPLDLATAKAGDKIAELVYKHNNVSWVWLHALFIYMTEGMIACYNYTKEDEKYGTYEEPKIEEDTVEARICPVCGTQLADELFSETEINEFGPGDDDVELHDLLINKHEIVCPQCAAQLDPDLQKSPLIVEKIVGVTNKPKSRQCIEVYGGLYVKVPNYAMKQEDIPYLIFSYETHYSNIIERYPHLRDKITRDGKVTSGGLYTPYERWGRLSTQYRGEYPLNTKTVRNAWLRPAAFNVLDEDTAKELKKRFPDGCKVVFIDEHYADACNESLDDCWTLSRNPLSDYLHHDPMGMLVVSIQDITNDLIALTIQTIEQGIPSTFADPGIVDFEAYRESEATPGAMYPTKPQNSNKTIAEGFFTTKTASLSAEVMPFGQKVQEYGQFVSGALPSLWGGQIAAGSDTASEYAMSRSQAQQRLGIVYKVFVWWWKQIFGKVIPAYIEDMVGDERIVTKDNQGNFINEFIRQAETQGKIGEIELEASESLPITREQKREVLMKLIELNNPQILQTLTAPENLQLIRDVVGIDSFVMPGDTDRDYQYDVIQKLIQSGPLDQMTPSIPIDPDLDNPQIGAEICRNWLISDIGRQIKIDNPDGYMNVLLRLKQFNMMMQQQQMMMAQAQGANAEAPNARTPEKPKESDNSAPVKENNDAIAPVH